MLLGSSLGDASGPAASSATALMGRFPASYAEPAAAGAAPGAAPAAAGASPAGSNSENHRAAAAAATSAAAAAPAAAPQADPATLAALEGCINRIRPLAAFQQDRDRRRRPVGAHVPLLLHPMIDEPSCHAALETVYTTVTAGQARALWPLLPKGPPRGAGAAAGAGLASPAPAAAAPLQLSAREANEAALLQALGAVLPEQHVVAMSAAPGMTLLSSALHSGGAASASGGNTSPAPSSPGSQASASYYDTFGGTGTSGVQTASASAARSRLVRVDSSGSMDTIEGGELLPAEAVTDLRVGPFFGMGAACFWGRRLQRAAGRPRLCVCCIGRMHGGRLQGPPHLLIAGVWGAGSCCQQSWSQTSGREGLFWVCFGRRRLPICLGAMRPACGSV
jgi:hypothetical protein